MADIVAVWEVSLSDGVHKVEFEHGTTSGMRIIRIDNKEILRRNWMFKLVGREHFQIGKVKASINIDASGGFSYEYSLEVNGKALKKFKEQRKKSARVWTPIVDGHEFRIVLEKDSMDVWCNGLIVETAGVFVDDGSETHFTLSSGVACYIKNVSSGKKKEGIIHSLVINDNEIPEAVE
ncbi:fas apoptotic inhibitory molecule 1-like [Asterias rubens]|uniref:fas apoptotic inhibitory molecule 1-like n=1 Tax=Asterias rubens TaxID=7604 RepID=UPI0014558588|nr:fas apoptotic inhibitory molecule 1-like [Asterias rubens]XP_033625078.1 fas apoptotic inhibitory molecule 1-like [Asterias rubens]